jgi:hypothetical protein
LSEVSPIKQIEQTSSRILYTNFSLKEIEKSISYHNSVMESERNNSSRGKPIVSNFDQMENN